MRSTLSSNKMETHKLIQAKEDPHFSSTYIRTLVKHLAPKPTPNETRPPQHKKQVRRRPHTSKPFQERLLNMAEARREIVTALKFHRASMKQQEANNNDHQEKNTKSMSNRNIYPPKTATTSTNTTNSHWSMSSYVPPPPLRLSYDDNQNIILPTQTLGLNLNFQNFSNLDTNIYQKPLSVESLESPSSSSSGKPNSSGDLHHAMDDNEIEDIRSLGEQHQIEWNDTINLMTSARWCNFLNIMKIESDDHQFDQVMEFPPWLMNADEASSLQEHFDDHISDAYFQDSDLPCMDIGEIEAMDGEWLA
ncbi:protein AAL-toxin resistant 7-like [Bidens hawaiensis]|uniref:protein AAL-toxin resistant 7-like n=1 Tax=Bidens hawaiensis TaxID=980011 RepID=UPI004048EC9E